MFMAAPFAQGPGGEEVIRQMAARSPSAGWRARDIAAATAFLCSETPRYITARSSA